MSNEITINITASGEDALKIFKALSTLSGVEVTTSTNIPPMERHTIVLPMEAELSLEPLPKKVKKNLGAKPGKHGRFESKADLYAFFSNHCAAGDGRFLTTPEVAKAAGVKWGVPNYWAKRTKNSFRRKSDPIVY